MANLFDDSPECCGKKIEKYTTGTIPRVVSYAYWECGKCGKKVKQYVKEIYDE